MKRHSPHHSPTYADIGYKRVGGRLLKLDIYLPDSTIAQLLAAAAADREAEEAVANGTLLDAEAVDTAGSDDRSNSDDDGDDDDEDDEDYDDADDDSQTAQKSSSKAKQTAAQRKIQKGAFEDTGAGASLMNNTTAAIFYFHGSGWWRNGSKARPSSEVLRLVRSGIAVISVEYRLTSQKGEWGNASVTWPAQGEDIVDAIAWLGESGPAYGLDPVQFGCWGESAGGHLCAWMATAGVENGAPRPAVAVNICGPACFLCYSHGNEVPGDHPSDWLFDLKSQGLNLLKKQGDYADLDKIALVRSAEPLGFVTAGSAPMFIGHGSEDVSVPLKKSKWLADAYRIAGVDHVFKKVVGVGRPYTNWPHSVTKEARAFVSKYLSPSTA